METINTNNEIMESERLIFIPVCAEYANDAYQELNDDITEHMAFSSPSSLESNLAFVEQAIKRNADGTDYIVYVFKKDGEFIGGGGLHKLKTKTPEFGVWVKKSAHGNKYGQEIIKTLKQWADDHLDYEYLSYPVVDVNIPSRKAAESIGGKVFRSYIDKDDQGKDMNLVEYRIYKL